MKSEVFWVDKMTEMNRLTGALPKSQLRDFERELEQKIFNAGVYFRLFSRLKTEISITEKLKRKKDEHNDDTYKMQDYIGFRIVLYFREDIEICEEILSSNYKKVSSQIDKQDTTSFQPQRINYVFELPQGQRYLIPSHLKDKVEETFEVQLRTIFSEGWHEVEHDLRYKCKDSWNQYVEEARTLNGILATLENCDWAITKLFDDLAYKNYKNKEWVEMIQNKFRIHLTDKIISEEIKNYLDNNKDVAKKIFKSNRYKVIKGLSGNIPFSCESIIYYIFLLESIDSPIEIPAILKDVFYKNSQIK